MTFMIYDLNHEMPFYPPSKADLTVGGSYYKFYQSKLRQLLTQTRYRQEQEARLARQKTPITAERFAHQQRLHKEYVNHLREETIVQPPIDRNTNDEKKAECVTSGSQRTPKLKPISSPSRTRVISAPIAVQRTSHKAQRNEHVVGTSLRPTVRISSSSRQHPTHSHRQARQSILDTIMLHLNTHQLPSESKRSTYQSIHSKFSASISPNVYRNFERLTV